MNFKKKNSYQFWISSSRFAGTHYMNITSVLTNVSRRLVVQKRRHPDAFAFISKITGALKEALNWATTNPMIHPIMIFWCNQEGGLPPQAKPYPPVPSAAWAPPSGNKQKLLGWAWPDPIPNEIKHPTIIFSLHDRECRLWSCYSLRYH